jgi:hypothetical protein
MSQRRRSSDKMQPMLPLGEVNPTFSAKAGEARDTAADTATAAVKVHFFIAGTIPAKSLIGGVTSNFPSRWESGVNSVRVSLLPRSIRGYRVS